MTETSILENTYTPTGYEGEEIELKPEFIIDDLARCEWFIRKVNNYKHDIETVNANAKKITERLQNELKSLEYLYASQFEKEIKRHISPNKKSIKTLWGVVSFRTIKSNIQVIDEGLLPVEYYQSKVTISLDKNKLKSDVLENGVSVPGVDIIPEHERIYINE